MHRRSVRPTSLDLVGRRYGFASKAARMTRQCVRAGNQVSGMSVFFLTAKGIGQLPPVVLNAVCSESRSHGKHP